MSTLKEMYKGIPNSPEATLTSDINSSQTTITVSDANIIPEVPNILVIGGNTDNPETVKVTGKNGNTLTVERGFQGVPRSWNAGTIVARNFTEYDYNALVENIKTLKGNTDINADNILSLMNYVGNLENLDTVEKSNIVLALNEIYQDLVAHKAEMATNAHLAENIGLMSLSFEADNVEDGMNELKDEVDSKETPSGAQAKADRALNAAKEYTDEEVGKIVDDLDAHKAENVQQFEEIYNRLSKLKGNDIQARREILDIKLKLDEMKVVDYLNKTGIGFYDLFENIEYIDISNTTATVDTASADVIFTGQESLKMLPQKFDASINNIELAIYDIDRESYQVDNSVSNSTQIQITIQPGKISIGDKYFYNGEVYEVTGVSEA